MTGKSMPSIRKTKTASSATAVQVVRYEKRKVVIMKHIGSATKDDDIAALVESAEAWIAAETRQHALFGKKPQRTLILANARYFGVTHNFARHVLSALAKKIGFTALNAPLLLDLAYMRIIEPCSKLRAITLMDRYFGVRYSESAVYSALPTLIKHKAAVEKIAVTWAKKGLSSDLTLVLYDVTTLYFETFEADNLRVPGFSKDNKSQQPQIVVGLLVTREGFPLAYEVFKGNTFEGKTMMPVIKAFAKKHGVKTPTVVADAAMISRDNVSKLAESGFSYIVGARLANCSSTVTERVTSALTEKKDGTKVRIVTGHGDLIAEFSEKRHRKDKADMEKQIAKAKALIAKGEPGKRAKFVKVEDKYAFDEALNAKVSSLLGIKGYYTNLSEELMDNDTIIARYHDLWHVEATFRMTKNDLATRPIFHRKEDAIKAHILASFVALGIAKYMELQTGYSLRQIVDLLWSVTEAHIVDTVTKEKFTLRSELTVEVREFLKRFGMSY